MNCTNKHLEDKTMSKLKFAQDLINTSSTSAMSGFDMFIYGYPPITFGDGYHDAYERMQGYEFALKMAKEKGIAFTRIFKCGKQGCFPFKYGGFVVCNACGKKNVDKKWWQIQVEKDGNEYCCHGLDFINLQESNNYAYGKTFDEAIENYGELMINGGNNE